MTLVKCKSVETELQVASMTLTTESDKEPEQISFIKKIKLICTNITVEPILICYTWSIVMASLATQNLSLEKSCRVNLAYSKEVCDALSERNSSGYEIEDEQKVQTLVSSMTGIKNIIQSVPPSLLLLFLGSWSDRHKTRTPCIFLPIMGEMFSITLLFISVYFFYQIPLEFSTYAEAFPPALVGGWFAMFMGVFSYIGGLTDPQERTLRIGFLNVAINISWVLGIATSGFLYSKIGFYGIYGISMGMHICSAIYTMVRIRDHARESENVEVIDKADEKTSFLKDFFDMKHVKDTFKTAFKQGKRRRKLRICVIMILVMVIVGPMNGEMAVYYLYVRYKFGWNEVNYSLYLIFYVIANTAGTFFSLMFFTKYLKMDDCLLGIISSLSKILAGFIYAFANTETIFYLGALAEMLNGTAITALRSIVSKLVPSDELGKINSLFGVCEALMPLVYGPMYTTTYNYTINVFPGTFFLLGAVQTIPSVLIFLWLYSEIKQDKRLDEAKPENEEFLNNNPNESKTS